MLRFIGRLILIPLGILLAAFIAMLFLGFVAVVQPFAAEALTGWALKAFETLWNAVMEGDTAVQNYAMSLVSFSRVPIVVLFLPVAIVAAVAEVFAMRSWFLQMLLAALLTALVPFALAPEVMGRAPLASVITGVLAATGALAGTIYWMVAGRSAGADPQTIEERATVKAPAVRR
ncbi:MAG: hypothetical protein ACRCTI_20025 [Beijerinckiaceae bacterium]